MQTEQSRGRSSPSLWALLVGIDGYKAVNNLNGCVNDVAAMRTFLISQGVPEDHIRLLTNAQATRTAILRTFKEFLIENPAIAFNDQILFHYSGHGSQMPDTTGTEPDGLDETIVPYDGRTPGIYDIPDKALAILLARLAKKKGDHITVILDSCHSGAATRKLDLPGTACVRQIPADDRIPPTDLDADLLTDTAVRSIEVAGPSGWARTETPYVLLAGCRDHEFSNEYQGKDAGQEGIWHGAMTYFTLQALRQMAPGTTYAELHELIAAQVNVIYRDQTPQCEGDRDRVVFGDLQIQRDPFLTVQQIEDDTVILGAGLVHGLRVGTKLALYPPETRTREQLPPVPLTTVEVSQVTATTAYAPIPASARQLPLLHARGLITEQVYEGLSQTVALIAEADQENQQAIERLQQAILHVLPDEQPSSYLKIATDSAAANMHVVASGGKLQIYNANGVLLVEPTDIQVQGQNDAEAVVHALESIVRYQAILALKSVGQDSRLIGKIKLRLRHYVAGHPLAQAQPLPAEATGQGGELTVYFHPKQKDQNQYVVDVINESELEVYPHVFTLSPDYSISRLYPRLSQQEAIKPGTTFTLPQPLRCYLPEGWDASHDYVKIFVTTVPTDLGVLEQKGLEVSPPKVVRERGEASRLRHIIDAATYGARTRFIEPAEVAAEEDWAVAELPITTVRVFEWAKLDSPARDIPLGDGLTLIKPAGFRGQVTATTWGQATRGVDSDPALKPPPGLEHFPNLFQPLGRSGTRSVGSPNLVLALNVDEDSRRSITQDNPLRLKVPITPDEQVADLLAVAFDGEDYLLVGYADGPDTVKIVSLPEMKGTTTTTRGLAAALKLFIYKKMGRYLPSLGLHRAELKDGEVVYSAIQRTQFQTGQKVAIFVHGFTSDTRWMIQGLAQFLCKEALPYDHLLTWDYESFGTSIQQIGTELALALRQQCGFGPDDGVSVHVYAHSMGCLVSRYMLELAGGYQFVDRLVLAGPPNQGTTLATLSRGILYMTNALINHYSAIPPLGAIGGVTKELYERGTGWADLAVNSQVVQQLNALQEPSNVPYLVLVGENLQNEQQGNWSNRLAQKVLHQTLDDLFGEENDMVIGESSMKGVRNGAYPALTLNVLPCDHFHYYDSPQGLEVVKQWLMNQ